MGIFGKIGKGFKKGKDRADSKEEKNLKAGQVISGPGRIPAEALKMLESWWLEAILNTAKRKIALFTVGKKAPGANHYGPGVWYNLMAKEPLNKLIKGQDHGISINK